MVKISPLRSSFPFQGKYQVFPDTSLRKFYELRLRLAPRLLYSEGMAGESIKFPDVSKIFPQAEQQKIKPLQMQTSGDKPRVLLADDDPIHSLAVFQALAQAGYEVVVAVTGTDAITELRKAEHPPVAILRSKLPGMSGIQICERMRDAAKDIYLIVYSEAPSSAEIVAGLESGADLLVPQSIPSVELVAHVKVGMRIIGRQAKL